MTIDTNLPHVAAQLASLERELPRAVARALRPENWIERAREVAAAVLDGLAAPDEKRFVPSFIQSVRAAVLDGGGGFSLQLDTRNPRAFFAVQTALPGLDAGARVITAANVSRAALFDLLHQWVAEEKIKDERDEGLSDQQITERLWNILFGDGNSAEVDGARERLLKHLVPYFAAQMGAFELAPERVDEWLRAVLAAWRVMFNHEIARRVRAELKAKKFP